jgi:hypothetical protein
MGDDQVTVRNCIVFEYFRSLNVLVVNGSVPGRNGGEVTVTVTRQFTPDELAEHEVSITLDEVKLASGAKEAGPEPAEEPVVEAEAAPVGEPPEAAEASAEEPAAGEPAPEAGGEEATE